MAGLSTGILPVSAIKHQRERGESEHLRGSEKAPVLSDRGAGDFGKAGRAGSDGDSENRQHHGRLGQRRDGHLAAAAEAAERTATVQSAQRNKETTQAEQEDYGQSAPEQSERGIGGNHGNHETRDHGAEECDPRRGGEDPGGSLGDHHGFAEVLAQIAVGLKDAGAATGLEARLEGADGARHQRRQSQQQDKLREVLDEALYHPRTANNNRRMRVMKM